MQNLQSSLCKSQTGPTSEHSPMHSRMQNSKYHCGLIRTYLRSGEALVSGHLSIRLSFDLLFVLLDQLCCLGAVVDTVKQAGIEYGVLSIGPALHQIPYNRAEHSDSCLKEVERIRGSECSRNQVCCHKARW